MVTVAGVDAVQTAEDYLAAPYGLGAGDPAGVEERGMYTGGSPGTWEALPFPRHRPGRGYRDINLRPASSRSAMRERNRNAIVVPPSEGNEARREE